MMRGLCMALAACLVLLAAASQAEAQRKPGSGAHAQGAEGGKKRGSRTSTSTRTSTNTKRARSHAPVASPPAAKPEAKAPAMDAGSDKNADKNPDAKAGHVAAAPNVGAVGDSSNVQGSEGEVRTEGDTQVKVMEFSGLDIEGQLKTPQMLYFLNRLRSGVRPPALAAPLVHARARAVDERQGVLMAASPATAMSLRVAMIWNGALYDERLLAEPTSVVLGETKQALFPLPEGCTQDASVTLLEPDASGYRVQPVAGMGGFVSLSGREHAARSLQAPVVLQGGDYGLVTFGSATVFFQQVRPVEGAPRKSLRDGALIACIALSVFMHVVSMLFLFVVAAKELAPASGLELDSDLVRKFLVVPPPEDILKAAARRAAQELEERGVRD